MGKRYSIQMDEKKAGVGILTLDKVDFKTKSNIYTTKCKIDSYREAAA